MCVLSHLLICTVLRAHIIVVEALYEMELLLLLLVNVCVCVCAGGQPGAGSATVQDPGG